MHSTQIQHPTGSGREFGRELPFIRATSAPSITLEAVPSQVHGFHRGAPPSSGEDALRRQLQPRGIAAERAVERRGGALHDQLRSR